MADIALSMRYRFIAVDGPIGAGKTTLVKKLAKDLGGAAVLEPVDKNPFLPDFYRDRKRYAFTTQLYFLLSRYRQQEELRQTNLFDRTVVCDYTFIKDRIFADVNLDPDESELYSTVFTLLKKRLVQPDLIIYLRADPRTLLQRIKKREVPYEREISAGYVEDLVNSYDEIFLHYNHSPMLIVDTSQIDYERRPADYDLLLREIANHRGGTVHLVSK